MSAYFLSEFLKKKNISYYNRANFISVGKIVFFFELPGEYKSWPHTNNMHAFDYIFCMVFDVNGRSAIQGLSRNITG